MHRNRVNVSRKEENLKLRGIEKNDDVTEEEMWNGVPTMPFQSTRLLLGIYGAIPFTWKRPHVPSLHPLQSTFVVFMIVFLMVAQPAYTIISIGIEQIVSKDVGIEGKVMNIEVLVLSTFYLITPTSWTDVSKVKRGMLSWNRLMKLYKKLTGEQIEMNYKRLERIVNVFAVVLPPVTFLIGVDTNPDMKLNYSHGPPYVYCATAVLLFCILWVGYFKIITDLARVVNAQLTKDLRCGTLSPERLQYYRRIWLEMRLFADSMNSLKGPVLICFVVMMLLIFLTYGSVLMIRRQNYVSSLTHLMVLVSYIILLICMARASHNAVCEIKSFYVNILARKALSSLQNTSQREIIYMYFVQNMRTTVASLGGFAVMNKALVISIFSTVATHLVIVFQIAESAKQQVPIHPTTGANETEK